MGWHREIDELHAFFERYFLGTEPSLDRVEQVLASGFTIVAPDGTESDRAAIIQVIADGGGQASDMVITTSGHRLILQRDEVVVARYIEHHLPAGEAHTDRLSTVVFTVDADAPNGLLWQRVHETSVPLGAG